MPRNPAQHPANRSLFIESAIYTAGQEIKRLEKARHDQEGLNPEQTVQLVTLMRALAAIGKEADRAEQDLRSYQDNAQHLTDDELIEQLQALKPQPQSSKKYIDPSAELGFDLSFPDPEAE